MSENERKLHGESIPDFELGFSEKRTYPLVIYDNHLIANISGLQVLIDTGSPVSIGRASLDLLGITCKPQHSFMGLSINLIEEYLGHKIDLLLGADMLNSLCFSINYDDRTVSFSSEPQNLEGKSLPVEKMHNVPIIAIKAGGQHRKVFFDTGAKVSYLKQSLTVGLTCTGKAKDFYPGIGQFETELYRVPLEILDEAIELDCGNLPALIEMTLAMANCDGILGNAIFKYYNSVSINLPGKVICLERRATLKSEASEN